MIYVFIHSCGEIVDKLQLDLDGFYRLKEFYDSYRLKYPDDQFCFDVMIT